MSENSKSLDEKKKARLREQFESMTDLPGRKVAKGESLEKQNSTFEIIEGESVLASKRVKSDKHDNRLERLLENRLSPSAPEPESIATGTAPAAEHESAPDGTRETDPREAARAALAFELESHCLDLVQSVSANLNLPDHLSEEERRRQLLIAVRKMVADPSVTGETAAAAALISGFYRDSEVSGADGYQALYDEPFGFFAADRISLVERKRLGTELFPETALSEEEMDLISSGFAKSDNFLLALLPFVTSQEGMATLKGMVSPNQTGAASPSSYLVSFPGAIAPVRVDSLCEGERAYGSGDLRGYNYIALLEKAYGQYLLSSVSRDDRPVIPADGANLGSSEDKAHLVFRLLSGKPARVFRSQEKNEQWGAQVSTALREARAKEQAVYVLRKFKVLAGDKELTVVRHENLSFAGPRMETISFNQTGRLVRDELTLQDLLATAQLICLTV